MEKAPSAGKTTAIAAVSSTQLITLLLYVVHVWGINDMTPEVAGAIVGLAVALTGGLMHLFQREKEKKESAADAQTNGVIGGPQPQNPAGVVQ